MIPFTNNFYNLNIFLSKPKPSPSIIALSRAISNFYNVVRDIEWQYSCQWPSFGLNKHLSFEGCH